MSHANACEACDSHVFTARVPTDQYGPVRLCAHCAGFADEEEFRQLYDDDFEPSRPELAARGMLDDVVAVG